MPTISASVSRMIDDVPTQSIYEAARVPSNMPQWLKEIDEIRTAERSDQPFRAGDIIEVWEFDGEGPFQGTIAKADAATLLTIEFPHYALRSVQLEFTSHGQRAEAVYRLTAQPAHKDVAAHIMFRVARKYMHKEVAREASEDLDRLIALAMNMEAGS